MAGIGSARGMTRGGTPLRAAATFGAALAGVAVLATAHGGGPGAAAVEVAPGAAAVGDGPGAATVEVGPGAAAVEVARAAAPGAGPSPAGVPGAARTQVPDGAVLMKELGCGGCHAGVPEGDAVREVAPPFGEGAAPFAPAYIFHYLADPQTVRPEIAPARMPRYDLSERERVALALFVTNERELRGVDDALRAAMARHPGAGREEGSVLFETLNCRGCHVHPDFEVRIDAPDLGATGLRVREDWLAGYLARPVTIRPAGTLPGRGDRMPDFRLTPAEIDSITGFLLTLETPSSGDPAALSAEPSEPARIPPWEPDALSAFSMRKAETLLRDRWSCLGCHQLGDDGGRIGPRLDGIAERLRPEYVRHLIASPAHLAPATVMPASLEQPGRIDLIASYLLLREAPWTGSERFPGLPAAAADGTDAQPGAAVTGTDAQPGAALYKARCASCHGSGGRGDGFNAPFLPVAPTVHADSAAMSLRPDDTLYDGIHGGGRILGKSHRMPAFGASLDHARKRALVAHIRTLCRCEGPYWSRDGRRGG